MTAFWNGIKMTQRKRIHSVLKADVFAKFYTGIMTKDDSNLNNLREHIKGVVHARFLNCKGNAANKSFYTDDIRKAVSFMRINVSPRIPGIQAEHLIHGDCDELVSHIAVTYNSTFSHTVTPDILSMGIIIPILKKPTLNPNKPDNYRPITPNSTHIKLIKILMIPSDKSCNSQYVFRQGRGTTMACSLINDLMYCDARGSLYAVLMPKNASTQYGIMSYFTNLSKLYLSLAGYFSINYMLFFGPQ